MILELVVLALCAFGSIHAATVFSSSLKNCQTQCEDRNLAYPLGKNELFWDDIDKFNYTMRINSCRHGCEDLDDKESKCSEMCVEPNIVTVSCEQGCRAVLVSFLAQAQALLIQTRVNMEIIDNEMKLQWTFPESTGEDLKELASADVFWFAQTRPLNGNLGWRWTSFPQGCFRNSTLSAEVSVPFEKSGHVEVRLALAYRSQVLVSQITTYQLPLLNSGTTLEIISQLQLSNDRLAVCYKTNQPTPKFKLSVLTLDGNALNTEESIARCHLFANLPSENCCKATISAIDESGATAAHVEFVFDLFVNQVENELNATPQPSRLVFTNGTHLLEAENFESSQIINVIGFPLAQGDSITAISGISENVVAIGSQKGFLWTFHISANQTDESQSNTVVQLRTVEETDTAIRQIEIDHIQKRIYAIQQDKGILRCKIHMINSEEPPQCVLIVNSNASNPPKQICLDSVNGHMYSLHSDTKVYKSELVAFNVSGVEAVKNFVLIKDASPAIAIFYDQDRFELNSVLENGSMISWSPIADQSHQIRADGFADVSQFRIVDKMLYYMKLKCDQEQEEQICIFGENIQTSEVGLPYK
ncbi:unnamed protein product [Caenorhabditis bovis]|uniref:Roller-3 N-terminal domain-containing protein n=1 Tax=Caenorhabditis bovis TaxID=2654633 RepID=A0A8S1E1Z2_9PELO|nr:unnamed protein product [Caenorhabditis bovis]